MEEEENLDIAQDSDQLEAMEEPESRYEDSAAGRLVSFVDKKFEKARNSRRIDEQRWLQAYRNYRGEYGPEMAFTAAEKSRIFVKVTKTKVLAAYGQIVDVLFGSDKFPLGISPTTIPEGVAETVHFETQPAPGQTPSEQDIKLRPGETMQALRERLGPLKEKLEPVKSDVKQGPGTTPNQITMHPAQVAAKNMEKKVHDRLEEANANKKLRSTIFEMVLLGTGVFKGPFATTKEYPNWSEDGEYTPRMVTRPSVDAVRVWDFYPDPDADNMEDCEFTIERHKLSRSALRKLKKRPFFRKDAVDYAIESGERYTEQWWEHHLDDEDENPDIDRFEALEYWGYLDVGQLKDIGVKTPDELDDDDQLSANVWVCNGQVLRVVLNPFQPSRLPYQVVPYELNPYNFFGVGVAENMEDTQAMMNGFMRMAIDNAALSGNMVFEVDETNLIPGQDFTMYPGKVIRRQAGQPGQSVFGLKFPNTANENMQMFDKARVLSDESTGLPSFAHGQTGVTGVGRTSSGISMLMNAANGSIRTVIKNVDDYLIAPLGRAMYHFNRQFDHDEKTNGDFEVKARGTESLMANEVQSQRLMQFLSVVQNPVLAPFAKMDYIIEQIAVSLDLDPEKVVNNMADAALAAKMTQGLQADMAPPEQGQNPNGPPGLSDPRGTGDGNIAPATPVQPGQEGFTGNAGGQGVPQAVS